MDEDKLLTLSTDDDIPAEWRNTAIEQFIKAHNIRHPIFAEPRARVLISACMDCRYNIPIPTNFAYVIRTPGGRLAGAELAIGYAISRGIDTIILVAHNDCGMTRLNEFKPNIIKALVEEGWSENRATEFVETEHKRLSIDNELQTLCDEFSRLRQLFKKIQIAPLFLILAEQRLYLPRWYKEVVTEDSQAKALQHIQE
jgi:carbonic anhydrase